MPLVDQERTMLVPARVISNRGPAGFAMTVVTTEAVVFVLGLADEAETLTAFNNAPSRLGRTITVSLAEAPLLRLPTFQLSTLADRTAVPWEGCAETNETLAGSESVTTTSAAGNGPRLMTAMV